MDETQVETHYLNTGMADAVRQALGGSTETQLALDEFPPVDELHIRGRDATLEMISRAGFAAGEHILDVGSGVGGPSRWLARLSGCRVTGIDLTESFCQLASVLAERTGMQDQVDYHHASALDMPFEAGRFDGVWMQHVNMNIEDKHRLFSEIRRVLKPGGKLALYEIIAGNGRPVTYPVPWARHPDISFLVAEQYLKDMLWDLDYRLHSWEDVSATATEWFRAMVSEAENAAPSVAAMRAVLKNANAAVVTRNMLANLEEGRIRVIRSIASV